MEGLNKYFTSETVEMSRTGIRLADYNPRVMSGENKKKLKANIKRNGIIGGLVVNRRTNYTLVSGHQRVMILDELNKYDGTKETDYLLKVEIIDVDERTEKELNIWFNNTGVQGEFDYDMLARILPDIDYKNAGLSTEDLQLVGVDFYLQTDGEKSIANDASGLSFPIEKSREEKKQAVKEIKKKVFDDSGDKSMDVQSYVILNFDTSAAKDSFLRRFGYDVREKFIKGEAFSEMIERIE
jgi:hypothetical protein